MSSGIPDDRYKKSAAASTLVNAWVLASLALVGLVVAGGVVGYVIFFSDPAQYRPNLDALRDADQRLGESLQNETAAMIAADMQLMDQLGATQRNVTDEQTRQALANDILLRLVNTELDLMRRTRDELRRRLREEMEAQRQADAMFDEHVANLTERLDALRDFDIFTLQALMDKMDNLTRLDDYLAMEQSERAAKDVALGAQDQAQLDAIDDFVPQLAAETAQRNATDMRHMDELAPLLTTGVFGINGQPPGPGNNMAIVSPNPGYVVGTGSPSNVVTLENRAMQSFVGLSVNETTNFDLSVVGGQNVAVSANATANSIDINLQQIPIPPNYSIRLQTVLITPGTLDRLTQGWQYEGDAFPSPITTNPATTYFLGEGLYLVKTRITLTVDWQGWPGTHVFEAAHCIGTRAQCRGCPGCNIVARTQFNIGIKRCPGRLIDQTEAERRGIRFDDVILEWNEFVDGDALMAGEEVLPVWNFRLGNPIPVLNPSLILYSSVQEVTRVF